MKAKIILDRIESDRAIFEVYGYDTKVIFPVGMLPQNVKEGDILNLHITRTRKNKRETKVKKAETRSLLDRLLKRK